MSFLKHHKHYLYCIGRLWIPRLIKLCLLKRIACLQCFIAIAILFIYMLIYTTERIAFGKLKWEEKIHLKLAMTAG